MLIPNSDLIWSAGYHSARNVKAVKEAGGGYWNIINFLSGLAGIILAVVAGVNGKNEGSTVQWLLPLIGSALMWVIVAYGVPQVKSRKKKFNQLQASGEIIIAAQYWEESSREDRLRTPWGIFNEAVYPQWQQRHGILRHDYESRKAYIRMLNDYSGVVNGFLQDPAVKADVEHLNHPRTQKGERVETLLNLLVYADELGKEIFFQEDERARQQALAHEVVHTHIIHSAQEQRKLNAA